MNRRLVFLAFQCLLPLTAFADIVLDQAMTKEQQAMTGVSTLSPAQKKALEDWINQNYSPKEEGNSQGLFVSIITADGTKVTLSDSSSYSIAPQDAPIAASWISSSASIKVAESNDPTYPYTLTNTLTKQQIKAKQTTPPAS